MLFSSFLFLFWFLPLTLALYFAPALFRVQGKKLLAWQNAVLLVTSLFFYAFGEPVYVLLLFGMAMLNALLAWQIPRARHPRIPLALAVVLDLSLLALFKYPPLLGLPAPHLPLGISFYTFQAISYVADVYKKRAKPAKSPLTVCLYVALFPQLIAGPIVRYTDVDTALATRTSSVEGVATGLSRFAVGLAKKVVLANAAGEIFRTFVANGTHSAITALLGILGFTFQIYFDFSGYTDMAIGLGRIFGFDFPENFNYPYIARSITDFWRRWHITLSSFFREYVYIPLGGNRRGVARTILNLFIVWTLTGLWHGASWNFVLWGLYYFLLLVPEKFVFSRTRSRTPRVIGIPLTFTLTLFGWMLFAFDGSTEALTLSSLPHFLRALVGFGRDGLLARTQWHDALRALPILALCALGATPLPQRFYKRYAAKRYGSLLHVALPLFSLLLSVAALADAGYNPFLYFRF